jgi:hypothetical protein
MSCNRVSPPRVLIDLEKLRHINCGLGRFSLHLGEGILADFRDRIEPVFLMPQSARPRFTERELGTVAVRPWRKEFVQRWVRPIAKPFLGRPPYAVWHMTNQMSRYEPLDPRVPVLLTVHDLTFLHKASQDRRMTPSPNLEPGLMRESSCPLWGLKGFSDEEATQCRADRGLASAG